MKRLLISIVAIALCCTTLSAQQSRRQLVKKLNSVYELLDQHYVEDVPLEPLVEEAIRATLNRLDPHSEYYTKEEMEALNRNLQGRYAGIGISNTIHDDTLVVRTTFEGSPAQRAGILTNDRIIAVDGKSIIGYSLDSISPLMRGDVGTPITLRILRRGEQPFDIELKRENIRDNNISAYRIDSVGYISISSFTKSVASEFYQAYIRLGDVKSLVVDLRDNGGGYLTGGLDLTSLFLSKDDVMLVVESKKRETTYNTKRDGLLKDIPLVVIINESTASASETFAGAIQDHDRGIIVGRTSYGKGLIQKYIENKDGSGMRITTARYKTPSGRIIQRPYTMGDSRSYHNDTTRYIHPDSIKRDTALVFKTLKLGREVYGGGGITPDIYIAPKGANLSEVVTRSIDNGSLEQSVVEFWERDSMESVKAHYPTVYEFAKGYNISPTLWQIVEQRAGYSHESITEYERSFVETLMLASLAERLYGTSSKDYIYISMFDYMAEQAIAIAKKCVEVCNIYGK